MNHYLQPIKNKKVFITGVTSGIGLSTAKFLSELKCEIFGIGRRVERLEALKKEIPNLNFMAGDINEKSFRESLNVANYFDCDIFINNAGLALGKDDFSDSNEIDIDLVLNTNVNSAFKLVKSCLKYMRSKGSGDIVNICSIASHDVYSGGAVYCASKHALLAMGRALREETHGENIRVINISPGIVETEFSNVRFRGDKLKANSVYQGFAALRPEDIAYQIAQALQCPRHVNLDEIIILATDQAGASKIKRNN